jgi:hypothetical protein
MLRSQTMKHISRVNQLGSEQGPKTPPIVSLIAGGIAGAVEAAATVRSA